MIQDGTHLPWFVGRSLLRQAGAVMLAIGATIAVYAIAAGGDRLVATIASVVVAASASALAGIAINEVVSTI
jgi:hypothetical protein